MTDKQPEALRLAHALCNAGLVGAPLDSEVAAELRRLHALNAELVEALREVLRSWGNEHTMHNFEGWPEVADARDALSKAEAQQ